VIPFASKSFFSPNSFVGALLGATLLALSASAPADLSGQVASGNPHGNLENAECTLCHRSESWTPLRSPMLFDHTVHTLFPLRANHADIGCARCHLDLRFDGPGAQAQDCGACHVDVHQNKLGTDCAACHRETSFTDVQPVEIHAQTFFPLTGAHLQLTCSSCHSDERRGAFAGQDGTCVFCHLRDYTRTTAPNHVVAEMGTLCEACHGTLGWRPALNP